MARPSVGLLLLVLAAGAHAQFSWQRAGNTAETPAVRYLYPEQIHIAANHPAEVELHFRIRDGLHINSHLPLQKSLIATRLVVAEPSGLKIAKVEFPDGASYALKEFPGEKLSVYTGELVLRAQVSAAPGEHLIEGGLHYQACDTDSCYPPKDAPVTLDVIAQ